MALRWVVAAAAVAVLPAREASACKCGPSGGPSEFMARSDVVFEGRAVARHATQLPVFENSDGTRAFLPAWSYEFVVDRQWKGAVKSRRHVAVLYGSCERRFRRGEPAMVYADAAEDGQLQTRCCAATDLDAAKALPTPIYEAAVMSEEPPSVDHQPGWPSDVPRIDPSNRHAAHTQHDMLLVAGGLVLALILALRPRR